MSKDEMLAALTNDQKIANALDLSGDYANASPADARVHEMASEIAENAYNRVAAGEFDDRFAKPAPEISTMEMEM